MNSFANASSTDGASAKTGCKPTSMGHLHDDADNVHGLAQACWEVGASPDHATENLLTSGKIGGAWLPGGPVSPGGVRKVGLGSAKSVD